MSGIVGILHRDQAPIDRTLLLEMTRSMAFHGPDSQEIWADGAVGLGHALLRTTQDSECRQPCSLDGVWISADARVDARPELIAELEAAGRRDVADAGDAGLILHAYHAWGEACLDHLIGDFAFLLWDSRKRLWFGARDQLGVKPFYYAEAGSSLLCGNTLNTLRLHPGVSSELNDQAIADYLIFGGYQNPAATSFAAIRRLPAGHCLIATGQTIQVKRYWNLPFREVRFQRSRDYVDRFLELFAAAVKDRLRTGKAGVLMSGGADSTFVAAMANRVLGKPGIRALTIVFDENIPDQERKYSSLAADFLRIPICHWKADGYEPLVHNREWHLSGAEPEPNPLAGLYHDVYREAAQYARVMLTGNGGDPVLYTDEGYIAGYLKPSRWGELLFGIGWCLWLNRRLPRLGFRSLLLGGRYGKAKASTPQPVPAWLKPGLEQPIAAAQPPSEPRSKAQAALLAPLWPSFFENLHPGMTRFPLELRHPFFDLRVVTYLTGIPALPWRQEKNILKAAGRGLLPDAVRFRSKTPLAGNPVLARLREKGPEWWAGQLDPAPELIRYANPAAFPKTAAANRYELWSDLRLAILNGWLRHGAKAP